MIINSDYYLNTDVVWLSRDLLGKYIFTKVGDVVTGGIIVETEAYNGIVDRASHAFNNKRTNRTEPMFQQGGIAYVYLCYGIHEMFNVVTGPVGMPQAVLIRAIEPIEGINVMLERRGMKDIKSTLTSGPGSLSKALGVTRKLNSYSLLSNSIWLEDRGLKYQDNDVIITPRIGVDYAGEDALLPYRFYVKGNKYVSRISK